MATIKIKIDIRRKRAKALLEYLLNIEKTDDIIEIEWDDLELKSNRETLKAMKEAKEGKTNKYSNSQELFNKLGI